MGGVGDAIGGALGSVGKALDPTSNNFLGGVLGNTGTRLVGDVATGGLAEFGRNNPFGIPKQYALPIAGGVGGALLGGPAGAMLGGSLGNILGGGPLGASLGLGAGGLASMLGGAGSSGGLGGIGSLLGGSLLGLGLAKDTSIPNVNFPSNTADQGAIHSEEDRLRGMQKQDQQSLMDALTTGPEGEAFRQKYNDLGLLNSGAFNTGLANEFANQEYEQSQQLQNLDASGLSRQFGLEDVQTQYGIAQALQQARQAAAEQQSLIGSGAYLMGGGGAGMGMGGGMFGGGSGAGGSGGGLFGGLGNIFGGLGSGLSGLFGGGGSSTGPATGDPNLDLYTGGNPFAPGGQTSSLFGIPGQGAIHPWSAGGGLPNLNLA